MCVLFFCNSHCIFYTCFCFAAFWRNKRLIDIIKVQILSVLHEGSLVYSMPLPTELKLMRSTPAFKRCLKTFFFTTAYCSDRTNLDNVTRRRSSCRRRTKSTVDLIWFDLTYTRDRNIRNGRKKTKTARLEDGRPSALLKPAILDRLFDSVTLTFDLWPNINWLSA